MRASVAGTLGKSILPEERLNMNPSVDVERELGSTYPAGVIYMRLFRDSRLFVSGYFTYGALQKDAMKQAVPAIIGLLALLGLADSSYLALVHYGVLSPTTVETSGVCRLAAGACEDVITSSQSTFFGIPHALLGASYFAVLVGAAMIRLLIGRWYAQWEMLGFLIAGLAFSAYLTQELILRLHVPCAFCLTAHAINAVIVALYAISMQ